VVDEVIYFASQNDPTGAANYVMQLPSGANHEALLNAIVNNWAKADPVQLLNWAGKNLDGANYDTAALAALKVESTTNPAAALAFMTQNNLPNNADKVVPSITSYWVSIDPQAAFSWAVSLPTDNSAVRDAAIGGVLSPLISSNPQAAADYLVQNFSTDPSLPHLAAQTAAQLAKTDPDSTLAWANSLPTAEAQNSAALAAIRVYSLANPAAAWSSAAQLPDATRDQAELDVIDLWSSGSPSQAAQAIASMPSGAAHDTATSYVANSWLIRDPNAASQWIDALPQGSAKDAAINQIIAIVGKNDPTSAFNWAVTLGNETTRNAQVVNLAAQWSDQNPTGAAAAAQNALGNLTGLTHDQKTALQQVVDKAAAK